MYRDQVNVLVMREILYQNISILMKFVLIKIGFNYREEIDFQNIALIFGDFLSSIVFAFSYSNHHHHFLTILITTH
jgi:hypothetical protein